MPVREYSIFSMLIYCSCFMRVRKHVTAIIIQGNIWIDFCYYGLEVIHSRYRGDVVQEWAQQATIIIVATSQISNDPSFPHDQASRVRKQFRWLCRISYLLRVKVMNNIIYITYLRDIRKIIHICWGMRYLDFSTPKGVMSIIFPEFLISVRGVCV